MEINDKTVADIASQLGLSGTKKVDKRTIDYLSSNSDAELEKEILKLKEQLKAQNISYGQQLAMLKNIAPMLDAKQKQRLSKIMDILKK